MLAGLLLLGAKHIIRNPELYQEPQGQKPPPHLGAWHSHFHLHRGQLCPRLQRRAKRGMGLIMLVLIGVIPTYFAIDLAASRDDIHQVLASAQKLDEFLAKEGQYAATLCPTARPSRTWKTPTKLVPSARMQLAAVQKLLLRDGQPIGSFEELTSEERLEFRTPAAAAPAGFRQSGEDRAGGRFGSPNRPAKFLQTLRKDLSKPIEYIPLLGQAGRGVVAGGSARWSAGGGS
jgi:PiT family inorganic phosphate transporter